MADIDPVIQTKDNGTTKIVTWETLTAANAAGTPLKKNFTPWGDVSVQILGTPDSATVVMQGSMDGTNWATLNDVANTAISTTTAGASDLYQIEQVPLYIRPSTSGGGGSQDVDVVMVMRRSNQSRQ